MIKTRRQIMLEHRIAKLEKKIGKGGVESVAYKIWAWLMDNGASTAKQIKDAFPPNKRDSIASMLVDCERMDCIIKANGKFTANPNYEWYDVGVITDYPKKLVDVNNAVEDLYDLSLDEIGDQINGFFDETALSSSASLVLDRQTRDKLFYTIEWDNSDYYMHMVVKLDSKGMLHLTVPCTLTDENDEIVSEFEDNGKDKIEFTATTIKNLRTAMLMLVHKLTKLIDQYLSD